MLLFWSEVERKGLHGRRAKPRANLTAFVCSGRPFFFYYCFQLIDAAKPHCAWHSECILMTWCMYTHLLIGLWKQWGFHRRWHGWSFHLALYVCMDLLLSASSLRLQSVCVNPHFQKTASGHLWTTVTVWTLCINTSCTKSSNNSLSAP